MPRGDDTLILALILIALVSLLSIRRPDKTTHPFGAAPASVSLVALSALVAPIGLPRRRVSRRFGYRRLFSERLWQVSIDQRVGIAAGARS